MLTYTIYKLNKDKHRHMSTLLLNINKLKFVSFQLIVYGKKEMTNFNLTQNILKSVTRLSKNV